jgi:hypothetical protein
MLSLVLCVISATPDSQNFAHSQNLTSSIEPVEQLFNEFSAAFGKDYSGTDGRWERLKIFSTNVNKIVELNKRDKHARYSHLTPWADLTEAEYTSMHGLDSPDMVCQFAEPPPMLTPTATPKANVDYVALGATVAVKNQGKCGSCWAHATTAVVEGRLKLDEGHTTSLSEQYLLDCDTTRVVKGCGGGLPERALQWLANNSTHKCKGIASEVQYPYTSASGTDPTKKHCNKTCPLNAKVHGFGRVLGDAQSMLAGSTQYGILSVAMDSHPLQFYSGGIITAVANCSDVTSNHAVAIVGYGVDGGVDYWKVRNSYGTEFGEQGYFRIVRSSGAQAAPCGMSGCIVAATSASYTSNVLQPLQPAWMD